MIKKIQSVDPTPGMACLVLFGRGVITFRRIVTPQNSASQKKD